MFRLGTPAVLASVLLIAACGADDAPRPAAGRLADPPARTEAQDQREIETLVTSFFRALVGGDHDGVWSLISSDLQSQVDRQDVRESVALVAQAYEQPGFEFRGFLSFASDGRRAEFQIDAFTTDNGVRIGTAAQAAESPPLEAVYEDGRWRLEPQLSLLQLNRTQIDVGD